MICEQPVFQPLINRSSRHKPFFFIIKSNFVHFGHTCIFFDLRIIKVVSKLVQNENDIELGKADLECEEAIMKDKARYGRVRTTLMKHLRSKYGEAIANRALSRINKRVSIGSLRIERHLAPSFDE